MNDMLLPYLAQRPYVEVRDIILELERELEKSLRKETTNED